jgi:hypothetical protein
MYYSLYFYLLYVLSLVKSNYINFDQICRKNTNIKNIILPLTHNTIRKYRYI